MTSDEVFDAISHPLRVEILRELQKGPIGFADLKRNLKIKSSGLLDFHLKKMDPILETTQHGLYTLNQQGYAAVQAVEVVSRHGWQRRSWFINVGMYVIVSAYLVIAIQQWIVLIPFVLFTGWIIFYSYWTFVRRRVRLRESAKSLEKN